MQDVVNNRELVSALADGQLCGKEFAGTVEWLSATDDARLTWHAYHLVGDVLRYGEMMGSARDSAFVQRLQRSLQQQARLAPSGDAADSMADYAIATAFKGIHRAEDSSANDTNFRWKLLAGVASLAVVSLIGWQALNGSVEQRGAPQLGQMPATPAVPGVALQQALASGEPQLVMRDPQLDALLAAHRQFGGTSALQMPAGFFRNAAFEGTAR